MPSIIGRLRSACQHRIADARAVPRPSAIRPGCTIFASLTCVGPVGRQRSVHAPANFPKTSQPSNSSKSGRQELPIISLSSDAPRRGAARQPAILCNPQPVDQGTTMSQQASSQLSTQPVAGQLGRTALLLACIASLTGCELPAMRDRDVAKCMIPPNHPHEFEAPPNFGYFPTLWRAWPGAETYPGQSPAAGKTSKEDEKADETESLPPPTEETPPPESLEGDMKDIFELPPGAGEQPMDEPGDATPPEAGPGEAPAEAVPPAGPGGEDNTLPESLLPEPSGELPATAPDQGAWNLETLPTDAPSGALVSEVSEPALSKPSTPTLLMPGQESPRIRSIKTDRIEKAERPSPTRGAQMKDRRPSEWARVAFEDTKPEQAAQNSADGPQLFGQPKTAAVETPATASSATSKTERPAAEAAAGWHGNPMRGGAKAASSAVQPATSSSASQWQRKSTRTDRTDYAAQRVTHIEPVASATTQNVETAPSNSGNPLR